MNETIDQLQENSLLLKGFSYLVKVYQDQKENEPLTAEQKDAIEYYITSNLVSYANIIKNNTDELK